MIKVMVVDDEYLIRIGIKSTIPWEDYGFHMVGDAEDGEAALVLFERHQPHIVITDIKMPKMDGLMLTQRIKTLSPSTKVVILSSHNDFEYAKKALTLGASDYILKATMAPEEIIETLLRIKKSIEVEQKETDAIKAFSHKQFGDLIKGTYYDEASFVKDFQKVWDQSLYPDFIAFCGRIDDLEIQYRKTDPVTKRLLKSSVLNILKSKMTDYYPGMVDFYEEGIFVGILSVDIRHTSCEDAGRDYIATVQDALKHYTKVTMSMSLSRRSYGIPELLDIVEEAVRLMGYKVFFGHSAVITPKTMKDHSMAGVGVISCREDELQYHVAQGQINQTREICEELFQQVCYQSSITLLNYICTQLVSLLNRLTIESGIQRVGDQPYFAIEEPLSLENVSCIEAWFVKELDLMAKSMRKDGCTSGVIKKAIQYMRLNHMANLTLQDVAEHVHISRVYLSQLFKQETGERFIDFLNQIRIDQAKGYLAFENLKTYEVAEKVGYLDSSYFTKTFKRLTGQTPTEFQKSLQNSVTSE